MIYIVIFMFILMILDVICFCKTKYPERHKWYYSILPFGGMVALLRHGRDK